MTYCLKGRELLLSLKRSDWLPPYDDESARVIFSEVDEICGRFTSILDEYPTQNFPDHVKVTITYLHQCLNRNYRYIDSYLVNRLGKVRQLRWETGPIIPDAIHRDILSTREKDYFMQYNELLTEYNAIVGLDLTSDIEPPKDLFIEVRVIKDGGKIMTDSGPVSLDKGSIHFLKRSDVEQFIREGRVEHVRSEGQC